MIYFSKIILPKKCNLEINDIVCFVCDYSVPILAITASLSLQLAFSISDVTISIHGHKINDNRKKKHEKHEMFRV